MPTTHVHIGVPKTGSTAIQRFASDHRNALRGCGLLYPETALRGLGHHDLAFLLDGGYPEWATPQSRPLEELADELGSECAAFEGDVLLSSEDFFLFPQPERLAELLATTGLATDRDLRIIVYLRRQDDLLVSWHNQQVKAQGFDGSFDASVEQSAWLGHYDVELARWADVFGAEQLDVRRYETGPEPGSLLLDFLSVVCPDASELVVDASTEAVNTRLTRDLLELQRIINRLPVSVIEKRGLHRDLISLSADPDAAAVFAFDDTPVASAVQLDDLMARYVAGNEAVSERFFGGEPVFGDRRSAVADGEPYPGLDVDTVAAVFGWLMLRR